MTETWFQPDRARAGHRLGTGFLSAAYSTTTITPRSAH